MSKNHKLYSQLDKTVVLGNVAFKDVLAWSENPLKSSPIQLHALERTLGLYCGCTRTLKQQGNFTFTEKRS